MKAYIKDGTFYYEDEQGSIMVPANRLQNPRNKTARLLKRVPAEVIKKILKENQ